MSNPGESTEPRPAENAKRAEWRTLHLWQIQPIRDTLLVAAIVGLLWLGYALSVVTVPLLVALALAYLFEPFVKFVTARTSLRRPLVALVLVVFAGLVVLGPVVLGGTVAAVQGLKLTQKVARGVALLQKSINAPEDTALRDELSHEGRAWIQIRDYVIEQERRTRAGEQGGAPKEATTPGGEKADEHLIKVSDMLLPPEDTYLAAKWFISQVQTNAESIAKQALAAGGATVGGALGAAIQTFGWLARMLFGAFLTGFFFYFFCVGYDRVLDFAKGLVPQKQRERTFHMVSQMDRVIAGFVRGRLTISAILIGYYALGYAVVGVPAWALMGAVVGVLTLIPYAAGIGIPVEMVLLWIAGHEGVQGEWWWIVGAPLVLHFGQQMLDDYFLTPRIQGKTTNMDMPTILFASIAGGTLAGFYGLLLAIPAAACIRILLKEVFWPRFRAWREGKAADFLPISKE